MPLYIQPRPTVTQPSDPSIRLIALTNGHVAIVDATDFEALSQCNWNARKHTTSGKFYAQRHLGGKTVLMHAVLSGAGPREGTDHINGDTLDNRRINLRRATSAENQRNRGKTRHNTSGFKGVTRVGRRWRAQIKNDGIKIMLGRHDTPEQAARAYDEAAKKYHGEFARLNFPEQSYR